MDKYMEEVKMEGRTIEYRPDGGGLDYHHSPLMAEIPVGDNYTHIHRSIEHLRSIGGGMLDPQRHLSHGITDLRRYEHNNHDELDMREKGVLRINEYKPSIHDLRAAQESMDLVHRGIEDHGGKGYSAPSTPMSEGVPEEKVGIVGGPQIPGVGDRRGRKKHISTNSPECRAPRGAGDPLEWGMLEASDHEVFGSKADLQLHTQIHLREAKPYKCSQCTKAFANSSYLSQHTRIHLGIKPYRCEICQRKFTQLSHLQQHIRTHTGDKPYKCRHPGCQKAFSQLSNLQSHSRCHQTDKPYKCNSCYKCFSDEPSLLEHIPKHKESKHLKTHICQYCGKSYTQETYLSKHMQKHAERADKRPPIAGLGLASLNRSLAGMPPNGPFEHPYWPKISPDSAAHLSEAMAHAQEAANGNFNPNQNQQQQHDGGNNSNEEQENEHLQNHHRSLFEHHRLNGTAPTDMGEDLVVSARQTHLPSHLNGVQNHPAPSSTPVVSSSYDNTLISKSSSTANSAFTPINSMAPHLNTLTHHHQLAQRPYLYDTLSFQQNKQTAQSLGQPNSFPNQLISLHQIRNYAHQPAGNLISTDHLIGHTLGIKEKQ